MSRRKPMAVAESTDRITISNGTNLVVMEVTPDQARELATSLTQAAQDADDLATDPKLREARETLKAWVGRGQTVKADALAELLGRIS